MRALTWLATCSVAAWVLIGGCTDGADTSASSAGSTAAASSGASSGSGRNPYSVIEDTYCATLYSAYCDAVFACCADPWAAEIGGLNVTECKKVAEPVFHGTCLGILDEFKQEEDAGNIALNQASLDDCLAQFKSMAIGGAACVEPATMLLRAGKCLSAFEGRLPKGAACGSFDAYQCKDGHCENGACVLYLKSGDACPTASNTRMLYIDELPANTLCNFRKGEVCVGPGDTGICGSPAEIGETCHFPSKYTRECRSATCDATGKCVPTQPDKSACFSPN